MGRPASAALATRWRERISRHRRSGLSIAEFCRRERLSQASFFAWRKRVVGQRAAAGRRPTRASVHPTRRGATASVARFVELPPPVLPVQPPSSSVQITLPGGAVVTLPQDASNELVAVVIRAAVQVPAAEACRC